MDRLLSKQYLLTGYMEYLMDHHLSADDKLVEIITPRDPRQRGTQLSCMFSIPLQYVHEHLEKRGVVVGSLSGRSVLGLPTTTMFNFPLRLVVLV